MNTNETYTGWSNVLAPQTRQMMREASKQMGDLVRSTLGPHGLDKMVVRRMPDGELRSFVSNDGSAIIEEFEGETNHPIAQQFIWTMEDHEADYGDGSTTMFLLAADLLTTAMDLAEKGVHPSDIVEGFSIGAQRTLEVWDDTAVDLINENGELDRVKLRTIATTGMTNGHNGSWQLNTLADTVVEAVLRVSNPADRSVRLDHAETIAVPGGSVEHSELVPGAVLPLDIVTGKRLLPMTGPVLLINGSLQTRQPSADVRIGAEGKGKDWGESRDIAANISRTGTVAVLVTGDADMAVAKELKKHGAVLIRNVRDSHFEYVAAATGAVPRGPVRPDSLINKRNLGHATVRFRDTGRDDPWVAFESADESVPAVTLIVRGGTASAAEEAERRIRDGKNALRAAIRMPRALPAGGAADMAAARAVRELASRFNGREQLAVDAFADTLESVPRTLARNAGLDPIGALAQLRSLHDTGYDRAAVSKDGIIVSDVTANGGLDAFQIRLSGLVRAVEFVNSLVRIDGMLVDERLPSPERVLEEPKYGPEEMPEVDLEGE